MAGYRAALTRLAAYVSPIDSAARRAFVDSQLPAACWGYLDDLIDADMVRLHTGCDRARWLGGAS